MVHEVPNGKVYGVLHPHFSKDGKKISWSEAYGGSNIFDKSKLAGIWKLKIADVGIKSTGTLQLSNIKVYQPGDEAIYENHGFSPDGSKLIFTTNMNSYQSLFTYDIYTMDLATEKITRLTNIGYNEHAQYSPNGKKIIWMSTNGNIEPAKVKEIAYTDWWIMDSDGKNKKRLTYFNEKGHQDFVAEGTCAADFAWAPDSQSFYGYYFAATLKNIAAGEYREINVHIELE